MFKRKYPVHDQIKMILGTPVSEIDRSKLRIKNVSLFIVERFSLLIKMKNILLFF